MLRGNSYATASAEGFAALVPHTMKAFDKMAEDTVQVLSWERRPSASQVPENRLGCLLRPYRAKGKMDMDNLSAHPLHCKLKKLITPRQVG